MTSGVICIICLITDLMKMRHYDTLNVNYCMLRVIQWITSMAIAHPWDSRCKVGSSDRYKVLQTLNSSLHFRAVWSERQLYNHIWNVIKGDEADAQLWTDSTDEGGKKGEEGMGEKGKERRGWGGEEVTGWRVVYSYKLTWNMSLQAFVQK